MNPYLMQNPFWNATFGNYGQPMQQQPIQQQTIGINGKYVNDFGEITASDIPMNGQPAVFIKTDKGEIQLREWSANGQIITTLFKPCFDTPEVKQAPVFDAKVEVLEPILDRINALEEKLDSLKPAASRGTTK